MTERIEPSDVVIAGAGPAGSALAIQLARCGWRVTLVDRADFPREKPCGEGLMPGGVAELGLLGVSVPAQPFSGVRYRMRGLCVAGQFPDGAMRGTGVRRRDFDAALCRAARAESNVTWVSGSVDAPLTDARGAVLGVRLAGGGELRAKLTVAADGASSRIRHALGWDEATAASGKRGRFGVRRHFRLAQGRAVPEWVDIFLSAGLEAYVTPLPAGEVGVALLSDVPGVPAAALFASAEAAHPELRELLEGSEAVTAPMGASPLVVRARRRFGEGVVLLGDAAGNCDPISGGGMTQALMAARMLAETLGTVASRDVSMDLLARFDRERERMLGDYRRLTAVQLAVFRLPPLASVSLRVLDAAPRLFSHLVGVASGTRTLLPWKPGAAA